MGENYRSRALKSRSKLRAAIGLRASYGNFLLHQNSSLFTVTFGEKVLTLANTVKDTPQLIEPQGPGTSKLDWRYF